MMGIQQLLLCFGALFVSLANGAKIRRVKAGKKYKEHESVHIVVNKVGYVFFVVVSERQCRPNVDTKARARPQRSSKMAQRNQLNLEDPRPFSSAPKYGLTYALCLFVLLDLFFFLVCASAL